MASAFTGLGEQTALLLRRELRAAGQEMMQRGRQSALAAGMLGASGALAVLGVASTHRLLLRLLEHRVSATTASLLAAAGYGLAAAGLAGAAVGRLRTAPVPLPLDTARDVTRPLREG